jgi:hypothetical protein
MNMNSVQICDLLNEDAKLRKGKLSENNSDIRSNVIKFKSIKQLRKRDDCNSDTNCKEVLDSDNVSIHPCRL